MQTPKIILLNGVGSSGKTCLARALQAAAEDAFLHVQMDAFLAMLPTRYLDDPDGFTFASSTVEGHKVVSIHSGPVARRAMLGMRHAIVALAYNGNNLIVDEVLLGEEKNDYARLFETFQLITVGVLCPLHLLEERERQRGDRLVGLARRQYDKVHTGMNYTVTVDTSEATPGECAQVILRALSS
ncbi:chloramphenicol 3-O phosphotransferase [Paraburkholderia sp. HC6.4b]|uniref:chloramphenicol phosphotransferase CPT family protein n=1 Tax=unclassified Paraburkholderia TaxID=2615204 RepID=UPI00161D2D0E|nr:MULTISPECIES: chloramphenicol phosphotransferase [unclassified Paraburkholderia]MBB5408199.1 chloramphenicol 3-O phosphotransferase [Paraburkholderia sp. HC6.4b]MBB5453190.1 chloramphenicol 3-O phosphotransferase [Paraburkholderia sp. Kb1A]